MLGGINSNVVIGWLSFEHGSSYVILRRYRKRIDALATYYCGLHLVSTLESRSELTYLLLHFSYGRRKFSFIDCFDVDVNSSNFIAHNSNST